jgi:hypothetical protein
MKTDDRGTKDGRVPIILDMPLFRNIMKKNIGKAGAGGAGPLSLYGEVEVLEAAGALVAF